MLNLVYILMFVILINNKDSNNSIICTTYYIANHNRLFYNHSKIVNCKILTIVSFCILGIVIVPLLGC